MSQLNGNDLEATYYCDFIQNNIILQAERLAEGASNREDLARRTIVWVRDEIRFGFDLFKVKASETLAKGYGACYNKSLLLTALLRANGFPAVFCSVPVCRTFMKPYIGLKYRLINNPFHHCLVEFESDKGRLYAEPTLDRATYESIFRPLGLDWGIEWTSERQDRLYLEHLQGEPKIHPDIDAAIENNVGNSLLPTPLARTLCKQINKAAWKRMGVV